MNNGKYFALLDVARHDLMMRSGSWQAIMKAGIYPVVVAETITFRKSLAPWMPFDIETKIIGWNHISAFIEQRFVVNGEIYAKAIVRIRYLKRERGIATPDEVLEICGGWNGEIPQIPEWVKTWDESSSLPKGKEPAPSDWN
jgi:acyl-CoA thioesterase FadM